MENSKGLVSNAQQLGFKKQAILWKNGKGLTLLFGKNCNLKKGGNV